MIVYGSSISPFVRKVLAFAAEAGVEVELKGIPLGSDNPGFLAASPLRRMPALEDGDFTLAESCAIVAYLDALAPAAGLIPSDPKERAAAIWWQSFADTALFPTMRPLFFNRVVRPLFLGEACDTDAAETAIAELPRLFAILEARAPAAGGFLVGDRLTLADIAVASPFANHEYAGGSLADYPRLADYAGAVLERPSFAAWVAKDRRLIARARERIGA